jgi:hypothetical protein
MEPPETPAGEMEAAGAPSPKKARTKPPSMPASVVVQFSSSTGEVTGPQIDLPTDSTPTQMEMIINELRQQQDQKVRRQGSHACTSAPMGMTDNLATLEQYFPDAPALKIVSSSRG